MNTIGLIGGGGGDGSSTNDSGSGGTSNSGWSEWRQAQADAGMHDEGYAGAVETQDNDADAVVDEPGEAQEIVELTDQSPEEVVETFDDVQPPASTDDVAPDTDVDYADTGGGSSGSGGSGGGGVELPDVSGGSNAVFALAAVVVVGGAFLRRGS